MGVIHKLRENVVSFIVDQKKNNPAVSVRQLSTLTSEQFQIKVSKSSISIVLKSAALSSSVGRRGADGSKREKFTIPASKKQEISKNMNKSGLATQKPSLEREMARPPQKSQETRENPQEEISEKEVGRKEILKEKSLPLMPDPLAQEQEAPAADTYQDQDFLARMTQLREQRKNQKVSIADGLGFIFLKAAQWEVSSQSLMGGLFRKHMNGSLSDHFDAVSDMFLFFKFLGAQTFNHISAYQGHGLWVLNDFSGSITDENEDMTELQKLFQWDKTMQNASTSSNFVMEYGFEKDQAFLDVTCFKLWLEDGSELVMDATLSSFQTVRPPSTSVHNSLPLNKAMTGLSNCLISNIQDSIFYKIPGEVKFDQAFYDMVSVFEGLEGKKILKISVFGETDDAVARFSTVPIQKRTFLIGVGPRQGEFEELTKTAKWAAKRPFYDEVTNRVVYFTETRTDFVTKQLSGKVDDFRVITVWQDRGNDPCWAILTNRAKGSGEDVLKAYISRWPYLGERTPETPVLSDGTPQEEAVADASPKDFSGIYSDFIQILHEYCQRHFFPPNYSEINISSSISDIYGISGDFYAAENYVVVTLNVPVSSPYRKDLEYAVKCVNERCISDPCGRRLWIEI